MLAGLLREGAGVVRVSRVVGEEGAADCGDDSLGVDMLGLFRLLRCRQVKSEEEMRLLDRAPRLHTDGRLWKIVRI